MIWVTAYNQLLYMLEELPTQRNLWEGREWGGGLNCTQGSLTKCRYSLPFTCFGCIQLAVCPPPWVADRWQWNTAGEHSLPLWVRKPVSLINAAVWINQWPQSALRVALVHEAKCSKQEGANMSGCQHCSTTSLSLSLSKHWQCVYLWNKLCLLKLKLRWLCYTLIPFKNWQGLITWSDYKSIFCIVCALHILQRTYCFVTGMPEGQRSLKGKVLQSITVLTLGFTNGWYKHRMTMI